MHIALLPSKPFLPACITAPIIIFTNRGPTLLTLAIPFTTNYEFKHFDISCFTYIKKPPTEVRTKPDCMAFNSKAVKCVYCLAVLNADILTISDITYNAMVCNIEFNDI